MALRQPMSRENRAKQFMPFAALKGFEEALQEKEKIVVDKIELSEERQAELDYQFQLLRVADMVTVVYYHAEEYLQVTGMVAKIDTDAKYLQIVNKKVAFSDIYELSLERNVI